MKVINKILCFLSVLVLSVSLLCFNVSAGSGVGNVLKQTDLGSPVGSINDTDSLTSYINNHKTELGKDYGGSRLIQCGDYWYQFTQEEIIDSSYIFACKTTNSTLLSSDNIYYISFTTGQGLSSSESTNEYYQLILFSTSPIYLTPSPEDSNSFVFSSDSELYFSRYLLGWQTKYNTSFYYYFANINGRDALSNIPISYSSGTSDLKTFNYRASANNGYQEVSYERMQCNFNLDTSVLPNVTPQKFDKLSVNGQEAPLSDFIDVKLTPEFCLDMDRVFDNNTGQNDYFKFEVTNNSDSNIQFCASIVDEQKDSIQNAISGTIFDGILQFDYKDWEEGYWNYISDSQYYADCYEVEEELFGLAHDYKRYAELRKGNFYWVLLKPGEKFEDFIYWENVNIKANTKYSFIVDAVPTELDYPTDVFYALDELTGVKVFSHNEDLDDRQYSKDESLEQYALDKNECVQVCNHVFSVKSIPEFTTEIKGGNSKITSGWHDTVKQSTNPYYREDTRNGEIKAVNNYSEYNGNLPDVDVNIDNLSVDNIKSYVSYSQDFFKVIKSVLCVFPSWVWVLICFGLTGLIVIAIVKALL